MEGSLPGIVQRQAVNTKAIASFVLGVLGLTAVPFVGSLLALVFGYTARQELDRAASPDEGRGLAIAGIVLGWVGVATMAVAVLAFFAVMLVALVMQRIGAPG
jgi:hypothetical protein